MSDKIKIIELNYYYHQEFQTPDEVISKHRPSNLFFSHLTGRADITLVKHANYVGSYAAKEISYQFFRRKNSFFQIPNHTHRFVRDEKPDIVLVQGLIFPLQVIFLRRKIGKHCKIVLQHQDEGPYRRKRIFQKWMDRVVDAYLFASNGNADEWFKAGVIKDRDKIFEMSPSSTEFSKLNKTESRQKISMKGENCFLWVGRLNAKKDPLTVLRGFEKYFSENPADKLYMIYGEDELLPRVANAIEQSDSLRDQVVLVGKIPNPELGYWYSAADYLVSGSVREGGSFALTEAMACGCIPIVTNIPAPMKSIENGKYGFYWEKQNSESLYQLLSGLDHSKKELMSEKVVQGYLQESSSQTLADKFLRMYEKLKSSN